MVYTALHHLIEQSKWKDIVKFLKDDPDTYHPMIREAFKDDLPLHLAIERKAPAKLILQLLQMYEKGACCKGRNDNLPLHTATLKSLDGEVIEALIRAHPYGLDERNNSNYTPRDYGHKDMYAYQALGRPTHCWKQLMEDEVREEHHDSNLHQFHQQVDQEMRDLDIANHNLDDMIQRLEKVQITLVDYESKCFVTLHEKVRKLEDVFNAQVESLENRICSLEDESKVSLVKETIAKTAAKLEQGKVVKMQQRSLDEVNGILQDISILRSDLQLNNVRSEEEDDDESNISTSTEEIFEKIEKIKYYKHDSSPTSEISIIDEASNLQI